MKVSIWVLSATALMAVAHAAAVAQYRPDLTFPPNFQPGPGGVPTGPLGSRGPVLTRPKIPGIGDGVFGSQNGPGSFSPIPSEPRMSDIVNGGNPWAARPKAAPAPNAVAPTPIPPGVLQQPINIPKIDLDIPLPPPWLPAPVVPRPVAVAESSWFSWKWAAGIFVGCLLVGLLCGAAAPNQNGSDTANPS